MIKRKVFGFHDWKEIEIVLVSFVAVVCSIVRCCSVSIHMEIQIVGYSPLVKITSVSFSPYKYIHTCVQCQKNDKLAIFQLAHTYINTAMRRKKINSELFNVAFRRTHTHTHSHRHTNTTAFTYTTTSHYVRKFYRAFFPPL